VYAPLAAKAETASPGNSNDKSLLQGPNLEIGRHDDPAEADADRVAERAVGGTPLETTLTGLRRLR